MDRRWWRGRVPVPLAVGIAVLAAVGQASRAAPRESGFERETVGVSTARAPTPWNDLPAGSWRWLPARKSSGRVFPVSVWTGNRLVVWGGETESEAAWTAGGIVHVSRSGRHYITAPSPLGPQSEHVAVWTGHEMLVCCGRVPASARADGRAVQVSAAAYHPGRDRWRSITAPPFDAQLAVAGWSGREMFVTGGIRRGGQEISDAAALYDPATDTWRMVAAPPHPIERNADIAWTGTQFLVWPRHAPANGMLFDPGTGRWTELPPLDEAVARGAMVWTGTDVIITGVNTDDPASFVGTRLSLDDMTWRPIAAAPLPPVGYWDGLPGSNSAIWAGTEMLVWAPWLDTAAPATPWLAYDPVTDTWRTLDLAPTRAHHPTLIWTGDAVLALTPEGVVIYRHP